MIEALKKLILELGGKIYVNTEVEKIAINKGKVIGVRTNRGNYKYSAYEILKIMKGW